MPFWGVAFPPWRAKSGTLIQTEHDCNLNDMLCTSQCTPAMLFYTLCAFAEIFLIQLKKLLLHRWVTPVKAWDGVGGPRLSSPARLPSRMISTNLFHWVRWGRHEEGVGKCNVNRVRKWGRNGVSDATAMISNEIVQVITFKIWMKWDVFLQVHVPSSVPTPPGPTKQPSSIF